MVCSKCHVFLKEKKRQGCTTQKSGSGMHQTPPFPIETHSNINKSGLGGGRQRRQPVNSPHSAGEQGVMGCLRSACLICLMPSLQSFRSPRPCRRPHPKSSLKFDLKCRPPKNARLGRKRSPMRSPNWPDLALKSALAAFLDLLDLKK